MPARRAEIAARSSPGRAGERRGPFVRNENIRNRGRLSSRVSWTRQVHVETRKKNTLRRRRRFKTVDSILVAESGHWWIPAGFKRSGGPTAALRATRAYLRVSECYYKWKHSCGSRARASIPALICAPFAPPRDSRLAGRLKDSSDLCRVSISVLDSRSR